MEWLENLPWFLGFWFGVMTGISPCPLATNIAAVSFLSKNVKNPMHGFFSALAYAVGRGFVYTIIALLLLGGLFSISSVALFLQNTINLFVGPLLILTAILLTGKFTLPSAGGSKMMERVEKLTKQGIPGAFAIGALFALSFCPVSAALFFGSMLPLSAQTGDYLLLPLLYGIGTALPVLCFSLVIIFATNKLGNIFNIITQAEKYLRYLAIILFIGIGIYYIIRHNFGIVIF